MRSTILFGKAQFSTSQLCNFGSRNSAKARSIFFYDISIALQIVTGHHRERRNSAGSALIERFEKVPEGADRFAGVSEIMLNIGMLGIKFTGSLVHIVSSFGDRQAYDAAIGRSHFFNDLLSIARSE